jgi:DNA-binding transcriptional LysR family regulator
MINLNQLRVFKAVFEEKSLTAAARRLRISQPAVSKQLAELEYSLGVALVDRLPRGVQLTAAGEALERHARRIFAAETAAEAELAELMGLSRGRLAIGSSTTIGSYLLPRVLGLFHAAHPRIELEVEISNTAVIQQAVLDGRVDVGLTEGFVASESLEVDVFTRDEMVVIVPVNHPWAQETYIEPSRLKDCPVIARERGSGSRAIVEAALIEREAEVEFALSLGSTEAVKRAVAEGLGVALVSRLTVALEVEVGRLVALPLHPQPILRDLHRIRLRGRNPSPATAQFQRELDRFYAAGNASSG